MKKFIGKNKRNLKEWLCPFVPELENMKMNKALSHRKYDLLENTQNFYIRIGSKFEQNNIKN